MSSENHSNTPEDKPTRKDWKFWVVFLSCCFLALLVSLDGTVIVIALPRIVSDLQMGDDYVWVANSFWVAGTILQPLFAQFSDLFGRKIPLLTSLAVFFAGGAIAGAAHSGSALIAGRSIQGVGGGGIMLLMEVVVCDIISLRERGRYLSIVFTTAAIGAIVGPPIGGAIASRDWRWIFFMNLPISAIAFLIMALLGRLKRIEQPAPLRALRGLDWLGISIFALSTTSLLLGLLFGGTIHPWSSWRTVLPLVLGVVGFATFFWYENSRFCLNPAVPGRLFKNRTSTAGYAMIFLQSAMTTWIAFGWPLFFQSVLRSSPLRAGINYIAFEAFLIPAAGISGQILTKFGHYRPIQAVGFCLLTLGFGLDILLEEGDSTVKWVCLIAVNAMGLGALLPTMLPAILASLSEADIALGTGVYSFLRSFGYIWGVTVPATIFNSTFEQYLWKISDMEMQQSLQSGKAYEHVGGEFIESLTESARDQVIGVYVTSIRTVWVGAAAFSAIGLVLVMIERHVPLRTKVDSAYGLETGKEKATDAINADVNSVTKETALK